MYVASPTAAPSIPSKTTLTFATLSSLNMLLLRWIDTQKDQNQVDLKERTQYAAFCILMFMRQKCSFNFVIGKRLDFSRSKMQSQSEHFANKNKVRFLQIWSAISLRIFCRSNMEFEFSFSDLERNLRWVLCRGRPHWPLLHQAFCNN